MYLGGKLGSKPGDGDNDFIDSHTFICLKTAKFMKHLPNGTTQIKVGYIESLMLSLIRNINLTKLN